MQCLKWIAFTTLSMSFISAHAATIPAQQAQDFSNQLIIDNYIGAGYNNRYNRDNNRDGVVNELDKDVYGSYGKYDVDKMLVSRTGTILTVDIFTSFWNNINQNNNGIYLGDLFMAATDDNSNPWAPKGSSPYILDRLANANSNTATNWNYVYDLGGNRSRSSGQGELKALNSSSQYTISTGRSNQAVRLADNGETIIGAKSNWSVGDISYNLQHGNSDHSHNYRNIRLSFDVENTLLATANQIAFRWAMTCANDIIEGLVSVPSKDNTPPTSVPEPQTLLLMLLGMVSIAYRRRQQD